MLCHHIKKIPTTLQHLILESMVILLQWLLDFTIAFTAYMQVIHPSLFHDRLHLQLLGKLYQQRTIIFQCPSNIITVRIIGLQLSIFCWECSLIPLTTSTPQLCPLSTLTPSPKWMGGPPWPFHSFSVVISGLKINIITQLTSSLCFHMPQRWPLMAICSWNSWLNWRHSKATT